MRKLCFIVVIAFGLTVSVSIAQQANKAYVWKMVPKTGMTAQVETALKAHAEWRMENDDSWQWDIFQVGVGAEFGTLYARSGGHTWADIDEYALSGSAAHFNSTVLPLLNSISNSISAGDSTVVNWPADGGDFKMFNVVTYDLKMGSSETFFAAVKKFHEAITASNSKLYYSFSRIIFGGDGKNEVSGVFPLNNFAGLEPTDPNVGKMMIDMYGEKEFKEIVAEFEASVWAQKTALIIGRPDLSVTAAN